MANVLESVMRLNDEYTATMKKITDYVVANEKAAKDGKKAQDSFRDSLRNSGAGASAASSGFDSLALKIGGIVTATQLAKKGFELLFDTIKNGAKQQIQLNTLNALTGDKKVGQDLYDFIAAYAKNSAMGRADLADAVTSFLAYTKSGPQLKQLMDLTQRLYMWNPEQGAEGAVFAIKEVLSGQTMSLKNRFNINGISAKKVTDLYNKGDTQGTIKYIDEALSKAGATQDVVDANFNSLTVQSQNFATNFADAMGNQANPAVQSLTQTLIDLNAQMKAGNFDGFFNSVAAGADNLALAGAWLAQNWDTVVPAMTAVIGAFTVYTMAAKTIKFVTETLDLTISIATGNWIKLGLAVAGAFGGWALGKKLLGSDSGATKEMKSYQDMMKKYEEDRKNSGAYGHKKDSLNTNITNSDPIKVSGTVEIEKENLKYVFDATTAKFFAAFNAVAVQPEVTIQNQNITEKADVQEINRELAGMLRETVTAGGSYK